MLHRETTSVRHFVARVPSASEVFIKVLEYLACTDLILPCFITGVVLKFQLCRPMFFSGLRRRVFFSF